MKLIFAYQALLVWMSDFNSWLIKDLVRYEFNFQAHIKLITKHIKYSKLGLFFIKPYYSQVWSWTILFSLGLTCLLNKPKIKTQDWLFNKQKIWMIRFIEPSSNCLQMVYNS